MSHNRIIKNLKARVVVLLTFVCLVGLILWSNFAELDQVSRAQGEVIAAGRNQIIQSSDGGVIGAIFVKEGDQVRKGEILVKLDPVRIQAAVEEGRAKVAALKTVKARIEAELFNRPLLFPDDVKEFPDFISNQRDLFAKRTAAQRQDIAALNRMLTLVRQELAMNQPLLQFGDVSRSEVLRLERAVADIEGQIASRNNKYLQDLQAEYAKTEEELVTAEQTLTQRKAALADTELKAPTDGIVKNVRLTTIGAVLRPGDEVLQIVPVNDELIVEAKVRPSDIAYVKRGQLASVKLDAFDSSIFGSAKGTVIYISPDTLSEQKPGGEITYYRVHIRIRTDLMRSMDRGNIQIQPGMTATAEILTGKKTILEFLLKPIVKTVDESFGER